MGIAIKMNQELVMAWCTEETEQTGPQFQTKTK